MYELYGLTEEEIGVVGGGLNRELQNTPQCDTIEVTQRNLADGCEGALGGCSGHEANTATDETPAKAAPLRALRLAFLPQEGGKY